MLHRLALHALVLLLLPPAAVAKPPSFPLANAALARLFDDHAVVHVGEYHRDRALHAFLRQLLQDPQFVCRVDDVVVEFGNARLQPLADDFASGKSVTDAQVQSLYRETMVPLAWNSPVYRQFLEAVREVNTSHRCARPLRLVLGDAPIDWAAVDDAAGLEPFADRGAFLAATLEREVLAKGRRALLVTGKRHALKALPPDVLADQDTPTLAQIVEAKRPGALFSIVAVPSPPAAVALQMAPAPSFRAATDGNLADAKLVLTYPGWAPDKPLEDRGQMPLAGAVDGVVSVGAYEPLYPSPTIYLEPDYQRELYRRAAIIEAGSGQDFKPVIDDLVRQAKEGGDGEQNNIPKP